MKNAFRWMTFLVFAGAAGSVAAFPIDSNNIYQVNVEVSVGDSDYRTTVVANCNDGDVVVSGGCYNFGSPATIQQSLKWNNGWLCQYDNSFFSYPLYPPENLIVYVIRGNPALRGAAVTCAHP